MPLISAKNEIHGGTRKYLNKNMITNSIFVTSDLEATKT